MGDVTIRPYEHDDRDAVRRICFETGYMGEPVAWQWRDAESFADLFSSYYTDAEPDSALVVDLDGEVAGYLLGCVDTARAWPLQRILGHHVLRRGIAFRRGTAGFVWRGMADGVLDLARGRVKASEAELRDPRWPAHLHIDLLPAVRGRGAGRLLMQAWLDRLREAGVPGCHLGTWGENTGAIAFFEAMGFRRHGRVVPMPGVRSRTGGRHTAVTMVTDL